MRFAVFDHNDATGRPPGVQLAERLSLIEAYERLGYYATHPVQRPLPLWYATMTLERARWCARLAMPMLALVPSRRVRPLTDAYRAEWAALGRAEADLPALGISRQIVIADSDQAAMAIANRAFRPFRRSISLLWRQFGVPKPPVLAADTYEGIAATGHCYAGDPAGARAWVAAHAAEAGVDYLSLEFCFGDMTAAEVLRSAELFATEVMPAFT